MLALLFMIAASPLPTCGHEDGSSQTACVWNAPDRLGDEGDYDSILNFNGGEDWVVIDHDTAYSLTH